MPDGSDSNTVPAMNSLTDGKYTDTRRKMLDLVNRLQSNGASLDLDLPQIAVIGNQSAGKSSLIESISGTVLVPIVVALSLLICIVALRFIEHEDGTAINPVRNVPFGAVMLDKAEVEQRLRRAQLAILQPSKNSNEYLDMSDDELSDVEQSGFSRNYISLQITGPDVPDLSFVDLPGIIASVKDASSRGDIDLVKRMVADHISRPSCIILLTVSCETDFENQGAYQLATEYDPDGIRTVGVLTKIDRIGEGDSAKWIKMLDGSEQRLLHGWYGVKQLNTVELDERLPREEARAREAKFFSSTKPWSNLIELKTRFGTPCLTKKLSEVLTALIAKRLPELQNEVTKLLAATETALQQLPPPPSEDPISELLGLIGGFSRTIATNVQGTPEVDGLYQSIREEYQVFRRAIRSTAPDFRPFPRRDKDESSFLNPDFVPADEHIEKSLSAPIYVDEVMEQASKSITRELPDNFPYVVTHEFITAIVKHWDQPAKALFIAVERKFSARVRVMMKDFFEQHNAGGLDQAVLSAVTKLLSQCREAAQQQLQWLLQVERDPFTLNDHYYAEYKRKYFGLYKLARQKKEHPLLMSSPVPTTTSNLIDTVRMLNAAGLQCTKDDLPNLLKPDPMDYALRIMAEVRAYYHVAYKRYADNIPLAIDHEYLRGFEHGIEKCLHECLGVSSTEARTKASRFLREADDVTARREDLLTRLERLEKANRELSDLWL
ncbi:P-loop containing nucleoside triphosphate hydrolase protein [Exidia glandulosa HHB12029]|uniref:p-loop containing nucleoside triphosphate hydrolase protein n=1 Tax=Exidia glandulosa HHB12029 TaxID=1314781 RepID=A0A165DGQ7_EXIGL|nr:P-loop containing nucleoside triphosphate hydrolase protein [Exidia glandulosa HHB12029]